ncbi:MAG: RNA polymerase sigma factor [Propionibacteriaceae bacterium]|nr:RNA polymerase sigma factor [Propionibacteriaceae bacterium]
MTESAAAELYRRHVGAVYRLCYAWLKHRPDTEDAVQETFVRLIRSGPQFESEAHAEGWLIRTAGNICKDMAKRTSRRRETTLAEDQVGLGAVSAAGELPGSPPSLSVALNPTLAAVLALPDHYKAVVYLYYYAGYSTAEIAERLRLRPSTVRNRLADARARLRRALGDEFDEE